MQISEAVKAIAVDGTGMRGEVRTGCLYIQPVGNDVTAVFMNVVPYHTSSYITPTMNPFKEVPYVPEAYSNPFHKFDLYPVPAADSAPLICFVHGGAWRS